MSIETEHNTPNELANDATIPTNERVERLQNWAAIVQRRLDSANEGMIPEAGPDAAERETADPLSRDAELLREIEKAIEQVEQ